VPLPPNSAAHDAIAVEASMVRLSRSDARQWQQLPKRCSADDLGV
jgi:hypothetical protein